MLVDSGRAAVFDAAHSASTPRVLAALEELGVAGSVDYLFISHAHLDHCGGAGTLLDALPSARLLAHQRALRHLLDPSLLITGARQIYADNFDSLYGEVRPVAPERAEAIADGGSFRLGGRELAVVESPGHSFDHLSVHDRQAGRLFAGDSFGITIAPVYGYAETLRIPSAPTQFAPDAWQTTLQRYLDLDLASVLLTHYGEVAGDIAAKIGQLSDELDAFIELARQARQQEQPGGYLRDQLYERWLARLDAKPDETIATLLDTDLMLASMGLELWMSKHLDKHPG